MSILAKEQEGISTPTASAEPTPNIKPATSTFGAQMSFQPEAHIRPFAPDKLPALMSVEELPAVSIPRPRLERQVNCIASERDTHEVMDLYGAVEGSTLNLIKGEVQRTNEDGCTMDGDGHGGVQKPNFLYSMNDELYGASTVDQPALLAQEQPFSFISSSTLENRLPAKSLQTSGLRMGDRRIDDMKDDVDKNTDLKKIYCINVEVVQARYLPSRGWEPGSESLRPGVFACVTLISQPDIMQVRFLV
jgi:hypothetical protein